VPIYLYAPYLGDYPHPESVHLKNHGELRAAFERGLCLDATSLQAKIANFACDKFTRRLLDAQDFDNTYAIVPCAAAALAATGRPFDRNWLNLNDIFSDVVTLGCWWHRDW